MFESATCGQALGDAREAAVFSTKEIGEIVGRGFTFHIGAECEDHFDFTIGGFDAPKELWDAQVFRRDAIERRKFAAEAMIAAFERAGAFQRKHIGRLFHHAKHVGIASWFIANDTTIGRGEKSASGARADGFLGFLQGACKQVGIRLGALQKPHGDAFRAAGAHAGETLELADQFSNRFRIVRAGHEWEEDGGSQGM